MADALDPKKIIGNIPVSPIVHDMLEANLLAHLSDFNETQGWDLAERLHHLDRVELEQVALEALAYGSTMALRFAMYEQSVDDAFRTIREATDTPPE